MLKNVFAWREDGAGLRSCPAVYKAKVRLELIEKIGYRLFVTPDEIYKKIQFKV
jgi:hypothetical protein